MEGGAVLQQSSLDRHSRVVLDKWSKLRPHLVALLPVMSLWSSAVLEMVQRVLFSLCFVLFSHVITESLPVCGHLPSQLISRRTRDLSRVPLTGCSLLYVPCGSVFRSCTTTSVSHSRSTLSLQKQQPSSDGTSISEPGDELREALERLLSANGNDLDERAETARGLDASGTTEGGGPSKSKTPKKKATNDDDDQSSSATSPAHSSESAEASGTTTENTSDSSRRPSEDSNEARDGRGVDEGPGPFPHFTGNPIEDTCLMQKGW